MTHTETDIDDVFDAGYPVLAFFNRLGLYEGHPRLQRRVIVPLMFLAYNWPTHRLKCRLVLQRLMGAMLVASGAYLFYTAWTRVNVDPIVPQGVGQLAVGLVVAFCASLFVIGAYAIYLGTFWLLQPHRLRRRR